MEKNYEKLKDLQIEAYEKYFNALTLIPIEILRQFPKFNDESYESLKMLSKRIKAKTLRIGKSLKEVKQANKEKFSNSSDFPTSAEDFEDFIESPTSRVSTTTNYKNNQNNTTFESPSFSYVSLTERIKASNNEKRNFENDNYNFIDKLSTNSNDTNELMSPEMKKSSFKVKRPVKTKMELTSELCEKDPQFQLGNSNNNIIENCQERKIQNINSNFVEMKVEVKNNIYETPDKGIAKFNSAVPSSSKSNSWLQFDDYNRKFSRYLFIYQF